MRCAHVDHKRRQCVLPDHFIGPHAYTKMPKIGARKLRERVDLELFRALVAAHTDGYCEAAGLVRPNGGFVCRGALHAGDDAHHIEPNDRDRNIHDPERGLWLCRWAHTFTHDNPEAARALGLLRPSEHAS